MSYLVEFRYENDDGQVISRLYTETKHQAELAVVKLQHNKSKPKNIRFWLYEMVTEGKL